MTEPFQQKLTEPFQQKISWVLFDTLSTHRKSPLRFFQSSNAPGTNLDLPGALPYPQTFTVERIEVRPILPVGSRKALSRAHPLAYAHLFVANKIYGYWPLDELVRLRTRRHRKTTEFGEVTEELRWSHGVSLDKRLLIEAQVHFCLSVELNGPEFMYCNAFLLRAMLHGTLTRPIA